MAPTSTQRDRDEARRQEKLKEMERQVSDGQLTIRQMTVEERERFPPPDEPRPARRRWKR